MGRNYLQMFALDLSTSGASNISIDPRQPPTDDDKAGIEGHSPYSTISTASPITHKPSTASAPDALQPALLNCYNNWLMNVLSIASLNSFLEMMPTTLSMGQQTKAIDLAVKRPKSGRELRVVAESPFPPAYQEKKQEAGLLWL